MSCGSAIYAGSNSASTLTLTAAAPTSSLPIGTTNRRFGCHLRQDGDGIIAEGQGYYKATFNASVTPVTAGDYTVTLFANGVAIPNASQTITAVAASTIAFNIPAVVRAQNCGDTITLTAVISTTAALPATIATVNTGIVVEKL